jgi:hypothetical protein
MSFDSGQRYNTEAGSGLVGEAASSGKDGD